MNQFYVQRVFYNFNQRNISLIIETKNGPYFGPEIDRKRGFDEIINSPIYKNYVISEDGKTSGIVVYLKKDERLAEYIKIKDKYFNQSIETSLNAIIVKTTKWRSE